MKEDRLRSRRFGRTQKLRTVGIFRAASLSFSKPSGHLGQGGGTADSGKHAWKLELRVTEGDALASMASSAQEEEGGFGGSSPAWAGIADSGKHA